MVPKLVTTTSELVQLVRDRRDELDIPHEVIDAICGYADGYTSKLLAPTPIKNFGEMSLSAVLSALALGIAVVVITEDEEQKLLVSGRWRKRIHQQRRRLGALPAPLTETRIEHDGETS